MGLTIYNTQADNLIKDLFEQLWRSRVARSSAHDWKSCNGQKPFEGSNPSFSAKKSIHFCGCSFFVLMMGKGFELQVFRKKANLSTLAKPGTFTKSGYHVFLRFPLIFPFGVLRPSDFQPPLSPVSICTLRNAPNSAIP